MLGKDKFYDSDGKVKVPQLYDIKKSNIIIKTLKYIYIQSKDYI